MGWHRRAPLGDGFGGFGGGVGGRLGDSCDEQAGIETAVVFGEDVGERAAEGRQVGGCHRCPLLDGRRGWSDGADAAVTDGSHLERVETQQSHGRRRGGGRRGGASRSRRRRRRGPRRQRRPRRARSLVGAVGGRPRLQPRAALGQIGRAARSEVPAEAAAVARRCGGGIRATYSAIEARRTRSRRRPRRAHVRRRRTRRPRTRRRRCPVVASRAAQVALEAGSVDDVTDADRRFDPGRVRVAAGREAAVGEQAGGRRSSSSPQNRK